MRAFGLKTAAVFAAVTLAGVLLAGCAAESATVQANPVWSATVPDYGVEYSKTTNVFPFYSVSVTAYSDRIEETGNILLFISWSKTTVLAERGADVEIFEDEEVVEVTDQLPTETAGDSLEDEVTQ